VRSCLLIMVGGDVGNIEPNESLGHLSSGGRRGAQREALYIKVKYWVWGDFGKKNPLLLREGQGCGT